MEIFLKDEQATLQLGARLAEHCSARVIFLHGELGAGKTTLVRGFLRACGHEGAVKSPTYTLVEPYALAEQRVFHFDPYRIGHPEELDYMGIRDYLETDAVSLIEWPERGEGYLPRPDLDIFLSVQNRGRQARLVAHHSQIEAMLRQLRPF